MFYIYIYIYIYTHTHTHTHTYVRKILSSKETDIFHHSKKTMYFQVNKWKLFFFASEEKSANVVYLEALSI